MGDRTPYTQRVDEDLQKFVDRVDNETNLSKADVLDEALRCLRDKSEITDDGQFLVNDEYCDTGREDGGINEKRLLENQEKIIRLLEDPHSFARSRDPDKNSHESDLNNEEGDNLPAVKTVERQLDDLKGEYQHDECLDPDDVEEMESRESVLVSHTARYLIPAVTGMLNYRLQNGEMTEPVKWDEIKALMRDRLDVSRGSVHNYRDKMVSKGVLIPHPSIDDSVVGEETVESARSIAASVSDSRPSELIDVSEMKKLKRERYPADAEAYIGEFVSDWPSKTYYVDEDEYRRYVWDMIQEGIIALTKADYKPDRGRRSNKTEMYEAERAAGAGCLIGSLIDNFGVCVDDLHRVRSKARMVETESDLKELAEEWRGVIEMVESQLSEGTGDGDVDDACDVFREIVGVDPDESTEEEMKQEYTEWVKQHHPDAEGSQDEIDREEFGRVMTARRVLLD